MKKIKQVIVVEGKHDTSKLKQYYDVETIETNGYNLSKKTIQLIKDINEINGIIIFTDPDNVGKRIRDVINKEVKGCLNAYLQANDCRFKHKVGIEHADFEVLDEALNNLIVLDDEDGIWNLNMLLELNIDHHKRDLICQKLHITNCNNKRLIKMLNCKKISFEKVKDIING
ncbi:MAG: ribonuclease M5 [Erysipelotrichaceae bacterium]